MFVSYVDEPSSSIELHVVRDLRQSNMHRSTPPQWLGGGSVVEVQGWVAPFVASCALNGEDRVCVAHVDGDEVVAGYFASCFGERAEFNSRETVGKDRERCGVRA